MDPTARFHSTRWSLVARATADDDDSARAALDELCAAYWYPLYAYLRRRGEREEDARDLVQGFLADLLERGRVAAEEGRGRFRSYLLGALAHHASNERRHAAALKRGGDARTLSLDGEARYSNEPDHGETPEAIFERAWAHTLLARAHAALRAEYAAKDRADLFDALAPALVGAPDHGSIAARLEITTGASRVAVHRLRSRLQERIRAEVAQTVGGADEVEDELGALLGALQGRPGNGRDSS